MLILHENMWFISNLLLWVCFFLFHLCMQAVSDAYWEPCSLPRGMDRVILDTVMVLTYIR